MSEKIAMVFVSDHGYIGIRCKEHMIKTTLQIGKKYATWTRAVFLAGLVFISLASPLVPIHAALIDEALLKGDPAYYQKLLSQITSSNASKEDVLLQKALVQKLLSLTTQKPESDLKVTPPSNLDQYKALFQTFINWSLERAKLQDKTKETGNKLKILKAQIDSLSKNDPLLLTLQLQYAFYKKELDLFQLRLKKLTQAMDATPKALVESLPKLRFDIKEIDSTLAKLDESINKIDSRIQLIQIEIERLNLLNKEKDAERLKETVLKLKNSKEQLIFQKLVTLFLRFSYELQQQDKALFKTASQLINLGNLVENGHFLSNDLSLLLDEMETLVLGKARTFHGQTLQEIRLLIAKFYRTINEPIVSINGTPISILKLLIAVVIFITGFFIGNFYKRNIQRITLTSRTVTTSTRTLLANLGYYAIVTFCFLIALKVLGIDLSSFALVAGALSVGIGFGLQNVVSNFISGLILMFERSVKIGDYIEFDEKLRGRVTDLRMRSMTITTNDNIDVIVPNQDFIQNRVINWTMNDDIRRFIIPFGVAYGTNPQKVIDVALKAVSNSGFKDLYISKRRKPSVTMVDMGDSSINFHLRIWIKGTTIMHPNKTASKFLILIYNALYEEDIEIPFPQRDLHIKSFKGEIPVKMLTSQNPSAQDI